MVWNEGYVSEVTYTYGFYGELSPAKLALATLIKAVEPPNFQGEFTYCELGCGQGYSINLLASTYPQAQFYATDFNPNQIAGARAIAQAAQIHNIHFFEDSFEQFIERDLPEFDFICLHGIYSWISANNRQNIAKFIQKKLKTGGLVYISYNALPGWAAAMPLRELMIRQSRLNSGDLITRINQSIDFVEQLLTGNAAYFAQNPSLAKRFENIKNGDRNYLAHEYFNQDWHPLYFDQVARELEDSKVNYLASANLLDHLDFLNLPQPVQQQLAQIADPIYREVLRDYFLNTQFRRDIFSRGMIPLTYQEQIKKLQETRFALIVPLSAINLKQQFPVGEITLQEGIYQSIAVALVSETLTLGQLQTHSLTAKIPFKALVEALYVMSGLNYIHPAVDDQTYKQRKKYTDSFNTAILTKSLYNHQWKYLASPVIGTGIYLGRFEQLFLLAKLRNQEMANFAWEVLSRENQKMIKNQKVMETPEENIACLQELAEEFCQKWLNILQNLGIA